jgi:hypothetical protein
MNIAVFNNHALATRVKAMIQPIRPTMMNMHLTKSYIGSVDGMDTRVCATTYLGIFDRDMVHYRITSRCANIRRGNKNAVVAVAATQVKTVKGNVLIGGATIAGDHNVRDSGAFPGIGREGRLITRRRPAAQGVIAANAQAPIIPATKEERIPRLRLTLARIRTTGVSLGAGRTASAWADVARRTPGLGRPTQEHHKDRQDMEHIQLLGQREKRHQ